MIWIVIWVMCATSLPSERPLTYLHLSIGGQTRKTGRDRPTDRTTEKSQNVKHRKIHQANHSGSHLQVPTSRRVPYPHEAPNPAPLPILRRFFVELPRAFRPPFPFSLRRRSSIPSPLPSPHLLPFHIFRFAVFRCSVRVRGGSLQGCFLVRSPTLACDPGPVPLHTVCCYGLRFDCAAPPPFRNA